ncbi:MAG: DNA polymerase IV [Halocynthiibacter sp.]
MSQFCRSCLKETTNATRCNHCGSPRVIAHGELFDLNIAHMDCDAFYASVEKRDNPDIRDKPVIIGGGHRGVVSTACYIARLHGVRSAMPMFKALKLCPNAVVIRPRIEAYVEVSQAIRKMMQALSPVIEPLSLDEAFIDMTGTTKLHGAPPAIMLARLVKRMKDELGITGSIGLSHNKFLAKVASDLDKPRGFSVIGKAETADFLKGKPVRMIWGVGPVFMENLAKVGINTFDDLIRWERNDLMAQFGSMGDRLWHLARGQDKRSIETRAPVKSISKETTFDVDIRDRALLDGHIWRLSEQVADRAKAKGVAGLVVGLRLKDSKHQRISRQRKLDQATQMADQIYHVARDLLEHLDNTGPFRLIGVGISHLEEANGETHFGDLVDHGRKKRTDAERARDAIRSKFGPDAIIKGRALR